MKWATKIRKLPPWARIVEDMCRGQGALGALRELRTSKPDAFSILNLTKFSQILEKGMCSKSDRPKCGPVICYMLYVWFFLEIETVYGEVDTDYRYPNGQGASLGGPTEDQNLTSTIHRQWDNQGVRDEDSWQCGLHFDNNKFICWLLN